jgi:ATP-binding cassette subfamily F protein 3
MMLTCRGISKAFGITEILKDITFQVPAREKAAIIGANGAGKTTLLKILTGELAPDSGELALEKGIRVGYMSQLDALDPEKDISSELTAVFEPLIKLEAGLRALEEEIAQTGPEPDEALMGRYDALTREFEDRRGYEYSSRIRGVINGLGFADAHQQITSLSGGEKTRVALGRLLLSEPDLLLLDEPTNHLDIASVRWLEDYLKNYRGSALIISHDRYFIDRVVTKVIEIENGKSSVTDGNYSQHARKKSTEREIQLRHYLDQQKEIKRQEAVITKLRSFNREKSIKRAESREKLLQKIERVERPENPPETMRLTLSPRKESGHDVLSVRELCKGFTGVPLFQNVSFEIKKGEKVALIGPNGSGKTTLLKIIMGELGKDSGEIRLGANCAIGYYDQSLALAETGRSGSAPTVMQEIADEYPRMTTLEVRSALAAFMFTGDDVFKEMRALSGGERGRVALCKIMLGKANFLILDEPTNHLDINSKEILEDTIRRYTGTVLYVSHDRYFINNTAEKIFELSPSGVEGFLGNYDYYMESRKFRITGSEASAGPPFAARKPEVSARDAKKTWLERKDSRADERRREARLAKVEGEIHALETALADMDARMAQPNVYSDPAAARRLADERAGTERELAGLYEEWEAMNSLKGP